MAACQGRGRRCTSTPEFTTGRLMRHPWISVAIKAAITFSLLGWLLSRIDAAPLLARVGDIDPWLTAAAIAVMMGQLLVTGWRWSLIARDIGAPLSRAVIVRLTLIGQFFNQTLPSAIGGDAVRAWLAAREGIPASKAISGVLADRLIALLMLVAIVGATLPLFFARVPDPGLRTITTALVVGSAIGLLVFILLGAWVEGLLQRFRLVRPLTEIAHDLRKLLTASQTIAVVAIAVLVHIAVIASVWLIARALAIHVTAIDCLVLVPPIVLLTTLPISIAGWGVRESATVIGFGFLGVAPADALALSVVFGLVQVAIGLPGGAAWLVQRRARAAGEPPRATL
jgi:glycosyltransferase 2 family protein